MAHRSINEEPKLVSEIEVLDPAPNPTDLLSQDVSPLEPEPSIVTYDKESPDSFYRHLSPAFQRVFERLAEEYPELIDLSSDELEEMLNPTILWRQIKVSFWNEYERSRARLKPVTMGSVSRGVCNENYLAALAKANIRAYAYIFAPPVSYAVMTKETLEMGIRKMRDIVTASVFCEDGVTLNPRAAEAVIKAVAILDVRVKGAVIQRIEQKSINQNYNKSQIAIEQKVTHQISSPNDMSEIERQIAETKARLASLIQTQPIEIARQQLPIGKVHEKMSKVASLKDEHNEKIIGKKK